MRFGDEAHDIAALLEHEGDCFPFVRAHAVRRLHTIREAPGPGGLPTGRVVAPQHRRRADLRRLQGRVEQTRTLERDADGSEGQRRRGIVTRRTPLAVHSYSKNAGARTASPRGPCAAATKRCAGAVRTGVSRRFFPPSGGTVTAGRSTAPNGAPAVAGTPPSPVMRRA